MEHSYAFLMAVLLTEEQDIGKSLRQHYKQKKQSNKTAKKRPVLQK